MNFLPIEYPTALEPDRRKWETAAWSNNVNTKSLTDLCIDEAFTGNAGSGYTMCRAAAKRCLDTHPDKTYI